MTNGTSAASAAWQNVKARDGAQLAYRLTKGQGPGRVVLIHSLAMDGTFWDAIVPHLLPHADVLVYDCRGHGRSDKTDGPYTVQLFADDLADILDTVGWRSATVCGASMGGCIAIAMAAHHPDRVAGLGLIDTTCWYGPDAPSQWAGRAQKALEEGMAGLVDFQKTRWFGDAFRAEHPMAVDRLITIFLANDVKAYAETCKMLGEVDERQALSRFDLPCQVIVGSEDYATPVQMAQMLASSIKGAQLHVIDKARHFTPVEVPGIVAGHLIPLVSRSR